VGYSPDGGQEDKRHEQRDDPKYRFGRRRKRLGRRLAQVNRKRLGRARFAPGQRLEIQLMFPRLDRTFLLGQVA